MVIKRKFRKHVQSTKHTFDGITFQSGLELHMYKALKKERMFEKYEEESFMLMEGFNFTNPCYERQGNGKGEYKDRSDSKIRPITYTPDFTGVDYIIETKGRANMAFPLRWKWFKLWLINNKDTRLVFKPQTMKECDATVRIILNARSKSKLTKTLTNEK